MQIAVLKDNQDINHYGYTYAVAIGPELARLAWVA
jgi:hypothetical protein